ncbi:Uncharacterised protein [Vibrio cholerae]|nr:Uncharacterised protein [Vibrio cholerae]
MRVGEQLYGGDVGVGINNPPSHLRLCVGLIGRNGFQAGYEVDLNRDIEEQPNEDRHHQNFVSLGNHHQHRHHIHRDIDRQIDQFQHCFAHAIRILHHFCRNAPSKITLEEADTLFE